LDTKSTEEEECEYFSADGRRGEIFDEKKDDDDTLALLSSPTNKLLLLLLFDKTILFDLLLFSVGRGDMGC
jgi:hypothetical protein